MMNGNKRVLLIVIPFALLMTFFFLVPLIYMLFSSFSNSEGITLEHYQEVLTNSYILQGFKNSLVLSLVSALIALIASLLGVYAMTYFSESVRERLLIFSNLTSNFSGVPLAFAFIVLLGNSGLFTLAMESFGWDLSFSLYSWSGLLLIYIYFQLPLAVMLLYPIYYGIQEQWKEAAALLGASKFMFWKKIGLPIIFPGVIGTFTILFANALGAYASAYALTGSNYNLAAIRIGALIQGDIFAQPELASAIAVLLGVVMIVGMLLNEWLIKKTRRDLSGR
jgi:putative spermidine/putrescine transport system permease protein